MTLSEEKIREYQKIYKTYLGISIDLDQARLEANHLVRILRILKRKTV